MQTIPLSGALGVEVRGLDLSTPPEHDLVARLKQLWQTHHLLLFRALDWEPRQQIAFARAFGTLDTHEATPNYRLPNHPELLNVTNKPDGDRPSGTRNTGRNWHSDYAYNVRPAGGSLLYCRERPPVGGDTMVCNMVRALETLSPALQELLERLWAVYDVNLVAGIAQRDAKDIADLQRLNPPIAHPAIRRHPGSGRRALFVSERVSHFEGLSTAESEPLIAFLCRHATRPENVYRHRWQVGDLLCWDNRATMHIALADFDPAAPRQMLRATLQGEETGRLAHPGPAA